MPSGRPLRVVLLATVLFLLVGNRIAAQAGGWNPDAGLPADSEEERYLRVLQLVGSVPAHPWSVRGFVPSTVRALLPADSVEHPWSGWIGEAGAGARGAFRWGPVRPRVRMLGNTTHPFGGNDGAVWAGRGLTASAEGGLWARWGRLHVRLAPLGFWAQNADFDLAVNGFGPDSRLRDPRYPTEIDRPQRMGADSYAELDWGTSSVTLDFPAVAAGVSTAPQVWGPALDHAVMMGVNGGGFPHLFLQTSKPLDLWVGDLSGRMILGRPGQSDLSPIEDEEGATRYATALILSFRPRGVPGLEVGGERFIHGRWPDGGPGLGEVARLFGTGVSTDRETNLRYENQLAGWFVRWAHPGAGIEAFGEWVREDFGRDVRHLLVEPDDLLARTLGVRWVLAGEDPDRVVAVRGEFVSAEVNHSERGDRVVRFGLHPYARYRHGIVRQGHTVNGQLLGSPFVYGGGGATVGADLYRPDGRWSVELFRAQRLDWLPLTGETAEQDFADVQYGIRFSALRFRGTSALSLEVTPSVDLNRNLVRGNHVYNLNVVAGIRGLSW